MSFSDWTKKKKNRNTEADNKAASSSNVVTKVNNPSNNVDGKGKKKSFSDWTSNKKATASAQGWAEESNKFLNEVNNYYGSYHVDDEDRYDSYQNRISELLAGADGWRKQYEGDKETLSYIDSVVSSLSGAKRYVSESRDYWKQFESRDAYDNYISGWLSPDAVTNDETVALRQEKYKKNNDRIAEIEAQLPWQANSWLPDFAENAFLTPEQEALRDEWGGLKAENTRYEREQKSLDDYYVPVTDEFTKNSAYRDYSNASKEELDNFDATLNEGYWWLEYPRGGTMDSDGNIYDSNGNLVHDAKSSVVEDKLGMFLSASDDDILEASNQIINNKDSRAKTTWASLLQEGDINSWDQLTDHEIDIYYDLYKREGQEAAYKYLDAMSTELSRRATQRENERIENLSGWELVGANITSVPQNILGGALSFVDDAAHVIQGKDINPYSKGHSTQNTALAVREKTAKDIDEATGNISIPWLDFSVGDAYQAVMSGADSAVGAMIGGNAYGVLMGMGAASSTAKDLYEKGASTGQMIAGGLLAGAAEMVFEKVSIDQLLKGDSKSIIVGILKQGGIEASEEIATEIANTITNYLVMGSESDWVDAETFAKNVVNAGLGGFISGGGMGGIVTAVDSAQMKNTGAYIKSDYSLTMDLYATALTLSADTNVAKALETVNKDTSDVNVGRLHNTVSKTIQQEFSKATNVQELDSIKSKYGDGNIYVDDAYSTEYERITGEKYTAYNASPSNTEAAESKNISIDEYNQIVQAAEMEQEDNETPNISDEVINKELDTPNNTIAEPDNQVPVVSNSDALDTSKEVDTPTIEELSKNYGEQAGAMLHTYHEGQDAEKYDIAYRQAYNLGMSGVSLSYAMNSEATSYLSENQRKLAYEAGQAAADIAALEKETAIKQTAKNNTAWKKGVVRGDGVTLTDLKKSFNDTQNTAYKLLSTYAGATGIDIVLYRSETDADGNFIGAQGKYMKNEPCTLYIDVNAGLSNIKSVDDLAKYTMLRTFAHEFTHFIEEWNPVRYNEFRRVVFDTLTERGENVEDLIEKEMADNPNMSYDNASREVVAEAMTDILPDANFVEELAARHKNIFDKLLEKLKEFVNNLKEHFNTIGYNRSREANALREQIGESVRYVENIVKLFDNVAVEAVENYQMSIKADELLDNATEAETVTETVAETTSDMAENGTAPAEPPFNKRTLAMLKSADKLYVVEYEGQQYVTNAYLLLATDATGIKYVKETLGAAETKLPSSAEKLFSSITKEITEAPVEITANKRKMYAFEVDGKRIYFDKKAFSALDGGSIYYQMITENAGILKSVDSEGGTIGFLYGINMSSKIVVDEERPSKTKSFSNKAKMQVVKKDSSADDVQYQKRKADTQGSRRLTESDLNEYLKAGHRENKNKHKAIAEGKKILLTNEGEITDYINDSINGVGSLPTVAYGRVTDRLVKDVNAYSGGDIDIEDNYLELISSDLNHAYKRHIKASEPGNIDLSEKDFENIPDYLDDYDELVYAMKYKSGNTRICVSKKIDNGRVIIIETVSKSRGSLCFKNMIGLTEERYILDYRNVYKKETARIPEETKGLTIPLRDATVSNNSIYKNYPNVNTDNEKNQKRTSALTDTEVLQYAADNISTNKVFAEYTDAQKDALRIFKERADKVLELQKERFEQGRLYKEQQFGKNVDRAAAEKTHNRMKVLDTQIERASAELLSVAEKKVLRDILVDARKVVTEEERVHGQEKLKRWRDRRNNADAIKKYRKRIQKDVGDISDWITHPNNKDILKHVPDALKESVVPFLTSINFMSKRQLRGGEATKADAAFVDRLETLNSALKNTIEVQGLYSGYADLPSNFMENLQGFIDQTRNLTKNNSGEFVINQMTSGELKELSDVVKTLKKYITDLNKFHANAMYQHVYEAGDDSIDFMSQLKPSKHTGKVSDFVFWKQVRPAHAFERFGRGGIAIYDGLRRGQDKLAFNSQQIIKFSENTYTKEEVESWEKDIKKIQLEDRTVLEIPVAYAMGVYELSKQSDSLRHMLAGGGRVAAYSVTGKKYEDEGHNLTQKDISKITDSLTPRQKEVADSLQKYMAEQGGKWGNYVSVARFGEELFGNPDYYPIQSDGRLLRTLENEEPSVANLYALLNLSFTKSRNEKAKNRLVIYNIFDVFSNHMATMAQYNAFALPILDALKWFNYQQKLSSDDSSVNMTGKSLRDEMSRAYGVPVMKNTNKEAKGYAVEFVANIIKAYNGTEAQGISTDTGALRALQRYNKAQVAYNLRVAVQQPTAIARAGLVIDYSSIFKAIRINRKQDISEMLKYSGIAVWKNLGFYDINISRGLTDIIKHKSTVMDKIDDVGMWGAEKADLLTWSWIWGACKQEVQKKQKFTPNSKDYYDAVTKLFEDVIYKTQVVDSILTKNEFLRSKGLGARTIGSFMSEATTTASGLINVIDKMNIDTKRGISTADVWKKHGRTLGRWLLVYCVSQALVAVAQSFPDAARDDDEYQSFFEKWLEAFKGNLIEELLPFNKLPIVNDVYELAKMLLDKWTDLDVYGNPPSSVFMQWWDYLAKGSEILFDKIHGEDTNYTWYSGIFKMLQAVSGASGLPLASVTREIVTAWNNIIVPMAPSLKLDVTKLKSYDSGDKAEIKYAYQDGYLTAEEAIQELLSQGLVENENEAYFTIKEWDSPDGEYSKYDEIYKAVREGGKLDAAMEELTSHGLTEKEVLGQIKSKVGSWYKDGEITKQQAVDMLTYYVGMKTDEAVEKINIWNCKVETSIEYSDIKEEYLLGNLESTKVVDMYVRYGGYSKDKATQKVADWDFEEEHGYTYSNRGEQFKESNITADELVDIMISFGGKTESEAKSSLVDYCKEGYREGCFTRTETVDMMVFDGDLTEDEALAKVQHVDFQRDYPDYDLSESQVSTYYTELEHTGLDVPEYADYVERRKLCKGVDSDSDGKTDSGSVKTEVLQVIDSLPITSEQKDALYYLNGWAESKIYEAPWH